MSVSPLISLIKAPCVFEHLTILIDSFRFLQKHHNCIFHFQVYLCFLHNIHLIPYIPLLQRQSIFDRKPLHHLSCGMSSSFSNCIVASLSNFARPLFSLKGAICDKSYSVNSLFTVDLPYRSSINPNSFSLYYLCL